jgi:branched-chain amino acid aminotransferase
LKEIFGAGTAAVVSPIVAFAYQGTNYQLPQIRKFFCFTVKEDLTKNSI